MRPDIEKLLLSFFIEQFAMDPYKVKEWLELHDVLDITDVVSYANMRKNLIP